MSGEVAISVKGLSKKFRRYNSVAEGIKEVLHPLRKKYHKEFWALKEVSFEVKKGETVGLIGRNGSGKSTLLQLICGVLQPTSGEVKVNGRVAALLELGAGFSPEFTGRENVYMNGALMGFTKEEIDNKFQSIIDFADIGDFIDQPVKTYSSGMYVRLAFSVAINVDPDILVVDEALAVGDMFFQAKCMAKLKQLMDAGVTVLFVTHDIDTLKALCGRSIYLNSGALVSFGETSKIADDYLRTIHMASNKLLTGEVKSSSGERPLQDSGTSKQGFKVNKDFLKRAELFRHGSGEARITDVEVLDGNGNPLTEAAFNEEIVVRMHVIFEKDADISITYHIRDDKNIEILSSNTISETGALIPGKNGDRFVVDFRTRVPLVDGSYNVLARITKPVIANRSAQFIDSIENAYVFRVLERMPYKLWSKVYCDNTVTIKKEGLDACS